MHTFNKEKNKRNLIIWFTPIGILFLVLFFFFFNLSGGDSVGDFFYIIYMAIFLLLVIFVLSFINGSLLFSDKLKKWAVKNNLTFSLKGGNKLTERIEVNPGKSFFNKRNVISYDYNRPYIEGVIQKRNIWLYPFTGLPPKGSYIQTTNNPSSIIEFNGGNNNKYIRGWCLEVATHRLPLSLEAYRHFIKSKDNINTESNSFERLYNINVKHGHGTLQLLDPIMIEILTNSKITAFEFSDNSVVLYYTMTTPKLVIFDNMLEVGLKVAEQVDRNFPLGKYEKK